MLSIIHQCQMMMMMPLSPCLIQRLNLNLSLNHLSSGERELMPLWKVPAHQVPQQATHKMKAKLNTAKIKNCTGKESECSNTKEKRSSPPHFTEGSLFADDDIDPFKVAREVSSNCWRLKISSCHRLTEADAFTSSRVFTCSAFHPGLQTD